MDKKKIICKISISGTYTFQVQKNKIQVPEEQETLQVHQKNVAHVLVISGSVICFSLFGQNGNTVKCAH